MANQWEPGRKKQDAYDCYVAHFGESENHVNEDIGLIPNETLPDHALLVGGFPCQDYSVARTGAKGMVGNKGVLWWSINDILRAKRPPFILLENVDRLLKSPGNQRGRDFGVILACFQQLGYSVEWRVVNAAEYGFPQRRRRVFIFAYHEGTKYSGNLRDTKVEELVESAGFFQSVLPAVPSHRKERVAFMDAFDFSDLVRVSDGFTFHFQNGGVLKDGKIYTRELTPEYDGKVKILGDILEKNADDCHRLNGEMEDWEYMKGAKKIERTSKTGYQYTFSEGPIAFPDPSDRPARTMLTSEYSKNRSTHVVVDPGSGNLRRLTPVEAERLNGFKDGWTDTGMSERFRYFCMGNTLVVGLVEMMGRQLKGMIEQEYEKIRNIERRQEASFLCTNYNRKPQKELHIKNVAKMRGNILNIYRQYARMIVRGNIYKGERK